MGTTQTKRMQTLDNTIAANAQVTFTIDTADDPCNIHGLIVDMHVGNTGVGLSFGQWIAYVQPRGSTSGPIIDTTAINAEQDNPIIFLRS